MRVSCTSWPCDAAPSGRRVERVGPRPASARGSHDEEVAPPPEVALALALALAAGCVPTAGVAPAAGVALALAAGVALALVAG